ncbi:MAG: hypothetical protein R2882_07925 [Gemmatimonadales bacterium]
MGHDLRHHADHQQHQPTAEPGHDQRRPAGEIGRPRCHEPEPEQRCPAERGEGSRHMPQGRIERAAAPPEPPDAEPRDPYPRRHQQDPGRPGDELPPQHDADTEDAQGERRQVQDGGEGPPVVTGGLEKCREHPAPDTDRRQRAESDEAEEGVSGEQAEAANVPPAERFADSGKGDRHAEAEGRVGNAQIESDLLALDAPPAGRQHVDRDGADGAEEEEPSGELERAGPPPETGDQCRHARLQRPEAGEPGPNTPERHPETAGHELIEGPEDGRTDHAESDDVNQREHRRLEDPAIREPRRQDRKQHRRHAQPAERGGEVRSREPERRRRGGPDLGQRAPWRGWAHRARPA